MSEAEVELEATREAEREGQVFFVDTAPRSRTQEAKEAKEAPDATRASLRLARRRRAAVATEAQSGRRAVCGGAPIVPPIVALPRRLNGRSTAKERRDG